MPSFLLKLLILSAIFAVLVLRIALLPKAQTFEAGSAKFEATIVNEPVVLEDSRQLVISNIKIYTDLYPAVNVGDRVLVEGEINEKMNMNRPKVTILTHSEPSIFSKIRQQMTTNIKKLLPYRQAALVNGAVLGVEVESRDFQEQLIRTGTIHVVVVSGQNLMLVAGVIVSLAKYLGRRKALIFSTIAVFLYAILAGFEIPLVRAMIIVLYTSVGLILGKQVNPLLSLLLAAVTILFIWPMALFEISFQLTFAASFGIITLGQKLSKLFGRLPIFGEAAAISIAAYLFTLPVIFYYFGKVSLLAPIVNILVAEAVLPIMILGFLTGILSIFVMPLAVVTSYFVFVPAKYFSSVVEIFSKVPFVQIELNQTNLIIIFFIYFLLFTFTFVLFKKDGQ